MRALERVLQHERELAAVASGAVRWGIRNALRHPGTRRWRVLAVLGQEAFGRAADALARGNRKVFGEIGREFARFLPLCTSIPIRESDLAEFLLTVPAEGQAEDRDFLRRAFRHLAAALVESDHNARAELMLLGNLEIAFYEQARVQPEILDALEAPYTSTTQLGRLLLEAIAPKSPGWSPLLRSPISVALGAGGRVAETALRTLLRRLITESMITLALPDGELKLGRNLTGDPPDCLRTPRHPELRELLERLAPQKHDLDGSGADDWSRLSERMTVIGTFFRLRHEDDLLYSPPFTEEQREALRTGRVPVGRL